MSALSESTIKSLETIREALKEDIAKADPTWANIFGKVNLDEKESESDSNESSEESEESIINEDVEMLDVTKYPSTQFHFTQNPLNLCDIDTVSKPKEKSDIVMCLYENLERSEKKLKFELLDALSDSEVLKIVQELEKKLSLEGVYNLCRSINASDLEERTRYAPVLLSHLLLPKIISLKESSKLLCSVIPECVQIYPDDICSFIFIPLLNTTVENTAIICTMITAYDASRKIMLAREFSTTVKKLQQWHLQILPDLLSIKLDNSINEKLIELFLDKAEDFSKDKNFGKLLLLFMNTNTGLPDNLKITLMEIVNVHETVFKKSLLKVLEKN